MEPSEKKHPPRLSPELLDAIAAAAAQIRQSHMGELQPATADRAARKFRLLLTTRRRKGRPRSKSVAIALRLRRQNKDWKDIYPKAIQEFEVMDRAQRWHRCYNLRQNVRRILKRSAGPAGVTNTQ